MNSNKLGLAEVNACDDWDRERKAMSKKKDTAAISDSFAAWNEVQKRKRAR
jgi:hypothetical protein